MTAFHAEVELGSLWKELPERSGPYKRQDINNFRSDIQMGCATYWTVFSAERSDTPESCMGWIMWVG